MLHSDRIGAGFQLEEIEAAFAIGFRVRFSPVSRLETVTVAPAMTALLESMAFPRMALVVSPWARAAVGMTDPAVIAKKMNRAKRTICVELDFTAHILPGLRRAAKGRIAPGPEIKIHYNVLMIVNNC